MESNSNQNNQKIRRARTLSDPGESNRILMQYGGVFKNNIAEFAEKIASKAKAQKNYSR
jgi:hypothetical protein